MIRDIAVSRHADAEIQRHRLMKPFLKAMRKLQAAQNTGVDMKKRKPSSANIWSFRITRKYRAFARKTGDTLFVYAIDDHQ